MSTAAEGFEIKGSGSHYFRDGETDEDTYFQNINTPARDPEFVGKFLIPLVTRAWERSGEPISLLDIACGPGGELQFVAQDSRVDIIATDIAPSILPTVKKNLREGSRVFAADVNNFPLRPEVADAGMIVNAMVYSPHKMLEAMYDSLKPGGEAVVNFRGFSNPYNQTFYDYYTDRGGRIFPAVLQDGLFGWDVQVLDYAGCMKDDGSPDLVARALGQQMFFDSPIDMLDLIHSSGLTTIDHGTHNFPSPVNPNNQIDVFTLQKP